MPSGTQPPPPPAPGLRVLFVDDHEFMRITLADYLTHLGYVVETAVDGVQGWHKFSQDKYDLVITDIDMPNMNGIALIRRLRESKQPVRIIVHSGLASLHLAELKDLAVNAVLPKGANADELHATIKQVVGSPA